MIAYDAKVADVERVGSHMQLFKTKLRTNLADQTFKSLVFLSFNLPHLHEIDARVLERIEGRRPQATTLQTRREFNRPKSNAQRGVTYTFLKKESKFHPTNFSFF